MAVQNQPTEPEPVVDQAAVRIGARIQALLDTLGQNPSWLAEHTGLERSTIGRWIGGTRNPTPETLRVVAPVLGVTVAQLVAGTDAATRVGEAEDLVARKDYEAAVHQVIAFETRARDLLNSLRDCQESLREETDRGARARVELEKSANALAAAQKEALRHERDALRYRQALEKAVADVAQLRAQVTELGASMEANRKTGRVAAILAGVAAVVSVASYLGNSDEAENDEETDSGATGDGASAAS